MRLLGGRYEFETGLFTALVFSRKYGNVVVTVAIDF